MARTKIICTIGPATKTKKSLASLIDEGMNLARLNFSHGTSAQHQQLIKNIRAAAKSRKANVAILGDLQGPRIRLGEMGARGRVVKVGQKVILTTAKIKTGDKKIPVTYVKMHEDLRAGQRILISDGLIELDVEKIIATDIYCVVKIGGLLESHKGINLPETTISIPALTEKDKEDVAFGVSEGVDFFCLSFVRSAKDIFDLRYLIKEHEKKLKVKTLTSIKIIAKIERREAIDNLEEVIEAADGVMIGRGDLGIELPAEDVPLIQKMIIDKCLEKAKPVIVATQMLDSMIRNPRPTRAEVSDVANAVIDHADALMLSGETASGLYPSESVSFMRKIIEKTEGSTYDNLVVTMYTKKIVTTDEAVSQVAKLLATSVNAKIILAASLSGYTGRIISRYRPEMPIYVACDDERILRQLVLSWGVFPFILPTCKSVEELIERSLSYLKQNKIIKKADKIIIIAGEPVGQAGNVNLMEIKEVD